MKVAVVGAGAMGALYGTMFSDAKNDVWLIDTSKEIVDAINARGVLLTRPDGSDKCYRMPATANPADLGLSVDAVLFQVKGFATAAAAETVRPIVGSDTTVISLQNGLGNEDVLRSAYPDNPLLLGISVHSAAMTAPGRYHHTGVRATWIGPAEDRWQDRAGEVATALNGAGYPVHVQNSADVRREVFAKWVLNCGSLPTAALTCLPTPVLAHSEGALNVVDALTREACEVAAAEGFVLDADERIAFNRELFRTAGGKASMLQDIEAGRRTEIDTITGAAVRLADKHGIPASASRIVLALVKGREAAMAAVR